MTNWLTRMTAPVAALSMVGALAFLSGCHDKCDHCEKHVGCADCGEEGVAVNYGPQTSDNRYWSPTAEAGVQQPQYFSDERQPMPTTFESGQPDRQTGLSVRELNDRLQEIQREKVLFPDRAAALDAEADLVRNEINFRGSRGPEARQAYGDQSRYLDKRAIEQQRTTTIQPRASTETRVGEGFQGSRGVPGQEPSATVRREQFQSSDINRSSDVNYNQPRSEMNRDFNQPRSDIRSSSEFRSTQDLNQPRSEMNRSDINRSDINTGMNRSDINQSRSDLSQPSTSSSQIQTRTSSDLNTGTSSSNMKTSTGSSAGTEASSSHDENRPENTQNGSSSTNTGSSSSQDNKSSY